MARSSRRLAGGLNVDAPRFTLDARGQLRPESADGQDQLSTRRGEWQLLPTTPDWLCLVRSPLSGGNAQRPRVVLSGDLGAFPLADLVAFLSQSRWTGVIQVHTPTGERSITLKEGEVRSATSDNPSERLGEVMLRLGMVNRTQLEETLRESPPSKVGRALVEQGVLQAHELFRCVTVQVTDIFDAIMLSREGLFYLIDQPLDEKAQQNIQLSTQSLLMDAIRKLDELGHFRKKVPSSRVYVARRSGEAPSESVLKKLEPEEKLLLPLIDGRHTLAELALLARLGEFDATKGVHRLIELKIAVVSEAPLSSSATSTPQPVATSLNPVTPATPVTPLAPVAARAGSTQRSAAQEHDHYAIARVYNFIFREIRDEVAKQGMDREFVASANAALGNLSRSPVLAGLSFSEDGSLPGEALISQFERARDAMGPDALAGFRQAMTDVMFFLLFQAGELLESHADEDLARRVKELLATLEQA